VWDGELLNFGAFELLHGVFKKKWTAMPATSGATSTHQQALDPEACSFLAASDPRLIYSTSWPYTLSHLLKGSLSALRNAALGFRVKVA
jgi:hypothetical protein